MDKINFDELVPVLDTSTFQTIENEQPIEKVEEKTKVEEVTPEIIDDTSNPEDNVKVEVKEETPEVKVNTENADVSTLFYQELVNRGLASEQEGKENYSWEDVESTIDAYQKDLPQKVTESILESTPKLGKDLIDFVFTKGEELTSDNLKDFMSQYITDINNSNVDFSNTEEAKSFLTDVYKKQDIRASQIEVLLDSLEDEGEEAILEEANKYKNKLAETNKSKEILNNAKEEKTLNLQKQQEFANSLVEELNNTGWKKQRIQKLQQDLSSGNTNKILVQASQSPKALIQLANLATYFDEKTGEFKFDDFIKQTNSPQAKSLKDTLTKDMFSTGTKTKETLSNPNRNNFDKLVPISPI